MLNSTALFYFRTKFQWLIIINNQTKTRRNCRTAAIFLFCFPQKHFFNKSCFFPIVFFYRSFKGPNVSIAALATTSIFDTHALLSFSAGCRVSVTTSAWWQQNQQEDTKRREIQRLIKLGHTHAFF